MPDSLRMEPPRTELAPAMPFVDFFVDDEQIQIIPEFLEAFEELRTATDRGLTKFVFFDRTWDDLETRLLAGRENIKYRFGWLGSTRDSGVRTARIIRYKPDFSYQGNRLEVGLVDTGTTKDPVVHNRVFGADGKPDPNQTKERWLDTLSQYGILNIDQLLRTPPAYSPEKARVSDVVLFLGQEMGLEVDVTPTKGRFPLYQASKTNLDFINHDLLDLAVSEEGLADYQASIDGNLLTFKPSDYKTRRRFWFARDRHGTMIEFSPVVNENQILTGSWGRTTTVGQDPIEKILLQDDIELPPEKQAAYDEFRRRVEEEADYLRRMDAVPLSEELPRVPPAPGKQRGRIYVTPFSNVEMVESYNRGKHEKLRWRQITATATIIGDPLIKPTNLIDVIVTTDRGGLHYSSGVYKVLEVTNRIRAGAFTTELSLAKEWLVGLGGIETIFSVQRDIKTLFGDELPDSDPKSKSSVPEQPKLPRESGGAF